MIHKAWTIGFGNADDLLATAALLEQIDGTLIDTYARETGQDPAQIAQWMADETWFTAEESVQHGFADRIAETASKSARASAQWDLSAYLHAPKEQPATNPTQQRMPDFAAMRRNLEVAARI